MKSHPSSSVILACLCALLFSWTQPALAQFQTFNHGDATSQEQYFLELINRARANPAAEAARQGVDLNSGLSGGTISTNAKQPLAFHPALLSASRGHASRMLALNFFAHTDPYTGKTASTRARDAGYPAGCGENLAWFYNPEVSSDQARIDKLHSLLFTSASHRQNMLLTGYDECGIGVVRGQNTVNGQTWPDASLGANSFASSDQTPGPLVVGVVYGDVNNNGAYDIGEGMAGIRVRQVSGTWETITAPGGGYALPVTTGGGSVIQFQIGTTDVEEAIPSGLSENTKLDLEVVLDPSSDNDSDGVLNSEDQFPLDSTKYANYWYSVSLGQIAAADSPLALMWDGLALWTVNSTNQLQVTWWGGSWQHQVFAAHAPVDRTKGLRTDPSWNYVWYIGTDSKLYATYYNGRQWTNLMINSGPFARVHLVDPTLHAVWTSKTDGTDAVIYWNGSRWTEGSVPGGGAVAFSGFDPRFSLLGWKTDGTLVERYWSGSAWLARNLPGAGSIGSAAGNARSTYGYDAGWKHYYYGTATGALGWTSLNGGNGTLHTGKVWPGSSTWVAANTHWVFCRDGVGTGSRVRVFYYSGGQWLTHPVAAYSNWSGDQAVANSSGRLYYVDPADGGIKCILY